jgi:hypothetical protein
MGGHEMKAAIIQDGKVVNIAVASQEFADSQGWVVVDGLDPQPQIGSSYDGSVFSAPERDLNSEWAAVRGIRDDLLTQSDPFVLPDRWATYSADKQQEWSDYRQTLRDIPQTFADPADVVWPTKP